jgi:hypothetical protein
MVSVTAFQVKIVLLRDRVKYRRLAGFVAQPAICFARCNLPARFVARIDPVAAGPGLVVLKKQFRSQSLVRSEPSEPPPQKVEMVRVRAHIHRRGCLG